MTARCGSNDPAHRAKTCRACDKIYKTRYLKGEPRFNMRTRADGAICGMCGLQAGNSMDIPVYRYPLKRHFVGVGQRWIGSYSLCDECVWRYAEVRPEFQLRRKAA